MLGAIISIVPSIIGWYRAKQEAKLKLYEIAWDATKEIAAFTVRHIRVILKGLMVLAILVLVLSLRAQRDDALAAKTKAESDFANYKTTVEDLAEKQLAQNRKLQEQALNDTLQREREHQDELARLNADSEAKRDELKRKIGALDAEKTFNDNRLNAAYQRVQILSDANGGSVGTEVAAAAGYSESGGKCDAAFARLQTVKQACAVTTSDFNVCAAWVQNVCENFGCGETK